MITQIAVGADFHSNSTVAACPPIVNLDDGGTYRASREQRWIWECLQDYAEGFYKLPGRHVVIIDGDAAELDTKRRSLQLISTNKKTIKSIALDTTEPLWGDADAVYWMRGTPAHVGKSAWIEEELASDLDNSVGKSEDTKSWWHLQATCEGVRLDVAHHASMSRNEQSKLSAPSKLAVDTVYQYAVAGYKPPHLVIRAHNHRWDDTYNNYPVRVLYTASWTLATEYVYRTGQYNADMLANIGGYYITCEDGQYTVKQKDYPAQRRNIWAMGI